MKRDGTRSFATYAAAAERQATRRPAATLARGVAALPLLGLIAACGGTSGAVPVATTRTPAVAAPSVTTPTQGAAATSPSATPVPPQPVVMITQQVSGHTVLQAMTPDGTPLWAAPSTQAVSVAGPRVFETDYASRRITVIERSGHVAGSADLPNGGVVFSPFGAEWAWSSLDSTSPSPAPNGATVTVSGSFWVAGLGEAPRRVYQWTRTGANTGRLFDSLVLWSDQGLVSSPVPLGAPCADRGQTVSYVVDPSTGARTDLASDGRGVVDVHAGVVAAFTDPRTVVLSGRTQYAWTATPVDNDSPKGVAVINPTGTTVMVPLNNTGCAGQIPEQRTAFIDVADHSTSFVQGVFGRGWLDDRHVVAYASSDENPELDIVGIDGSRSLLGHGNFVGVLPPS